MPGIAARPLLSLATGSRLGAACRFSSSCSSSPAGPDTRSFARVQRLSRRCLSVPHAAAAFGLAFLIAPSGLLARLVSPGLTGWTRPPDLLVVNDPLGLALIAGLVVKEIPFLLLVTLAALPQVAARRRRARWPPRSATAASPVSSISPGPPIYRQIRLAVFAVLAFASLGRRCRADPRPDHAGDARRAARRLDERSGPVDALRRLCRRAAAARRDARALAHLARSSSVFAALRDALLGRARRRGCAMMPAFATSRSASCTPSGGDRVSPASSLLGLWSVAGLWQFPRAPARDFHARDLDADARRASSGRSATTLAAAAAVDPRRHRARRCSACCARRTRGRTAGAGRSARHLPAADRAAGRLSVRPAVPVPVGRLRRRASRRSFWRISSSSCPMSSCRSPTRGAPSTGATRRSPPASASVAWRRCFAIRLPMLARAVLTAAAVGFAVSVGLYLPTLLIGAGR